MWNKILITVKKNKFILFSFAAFITFSLTLICIDIENFTVIDSRTIIIHQQSSGDISSTRGHISKAERDMPPTVNNSIEKVSQERKKIRIQDNKDSVMIPVNRFYRDTLSNSEVLKLYHFVLDEPASVNITFTNENVSNIGVSVYVVDVLNADKVSMTGREHPVLGSEKSFETGYMSLEAGIYFIRISQGSVYNPGSYKLWIRLY